MPRPTAHLGRPGTPVIPADWQTTHTPVVAKTWGATVTIRRPGTTGGTFDPETGTRSGTPHPAHFAGTARVQVQTLSQPSEDVAGDQEITTQNYLVVVDLDSSTDTRVDDLVTVDTVDDNGDPSLVGRELRVTGIARGSIVWERDLYCTDDLG